MFPRCSVILAGRRLASGKLLIGQDNKLPWGRIERDLSLFQRLTTGNVIGKTPKNAIVMGRKTWDSLPYRPLKNRYNWILSRTNPSGMTWEDIRREGRKKNRPEEIWVIGGGDIYNQCMMELPIERIFLTLVKRKGEVAYPLDSLYSSDATYLDEKSLFMRKLSEATLIDESEDFESNDGLNDWICRVCEYRLPVHPEYQYLNMIDDVIQNGIMKSDRTGVGTISQWGGMTRWDLRDGFPLLTTKRVFWRGVAEELLWFLRGHTDATLLSTKGVKIWDANGSREFLDNLGFKDRREGDLGPVYGFQWRHFGATYLGPDIVPEGGVDQIKGVLEKLRKSPSDRRCLVVAWNPSALNEMALPPCHVLFQLQGVGSGTKEDPYRLNTLFYQRSCDMGLGVPFNIASYALLTHIMAHMLGWEVGELVHLMGDVHVYSNHVVPLGEQLLRHPRDFPKLRIKCERRDDPGEYNMTDFELEGYEPHKTIQMTMAV